MYSYDDAPAAFAAGKLATLNLDLSAASTFPKPMPFKWKLLPHPPGPVTRCNFNGQNFYTINAKSQDQDLMWEVLKWWVNGPNSAFWTDNSGTYPARTDAVANGYGTVVPPEMVEALPLFEKYACGPEAFKQWNAIEHEAEREAQKCFGGEQSAQDTVNNIEKIVIREVGL